MEPRHARYPFLRAAREAVEQADVDLAAVVARDDAVIDRALERVESALLEGSIGEPHASTRVELLSYPVARVLVSAVDEHVLLRRYARGEAATAHERFAEELAATTELRSAGGSRLDLDALLAEFGIADAVRRLPTDTGGTAYRMAVGPYLELAAQEWGDEWRLVNRDLVDGEVPLAEEELTTLLRQAVEQRVAADLPFDVPGPIAAELEAEVAHLRERLADLDLTRDIDTVVPDLFPPCMQHLLDQVQKGEHLEHHSRFAIAAFLVTIGMSTDEIVELFEINPGFGEEMTRYQVDHIRGATSPTQYSPPACATMQSYGDCVNKDDICEDVIDESHPLNYYEHRLEEADEEELVDWREGADGQESNS
jgi:DNA primase large subunit